MWVTLPEGTSAESLFELAVEERVAFVTGDSFLADGSGERQLRLSYSLESPEDITEGIARLGRAARRLNPAI